MQQVSCQIDQALEKLARKADQDLNLNRQCRMSFKNLDHGDAFYVRDTFARSTISENISPNITQKENGSVKDAHFLVIAKSKLMTTNRIEAHKMASFRFEIRLALVYILRSLISYISNTININILPMAKNADSATSGSLQKVAAFHITLHAITADLGAFSN